MLVVYTIIKPTTESAKLTAVDIPKSFTSVIALNTYVLITSVVGYSAPTFRNLIKQSEIGAEDSSDFHYQ